jgi:DNA-binding NtrC family response regulator
MYDQAKVLIYGKDPLLLVTRRQILRHGGFCVVAISQISELVQLETTEFQVFVLCHTLTPKDQQEAIALSHKENPGLQTIVMTAYAPEFDAGAMSRFISPFDGPVELIHQVRKAMEESVGVYGYQGDKETRTVSMKPESLDQWPLSGWMYTGHAGQTDRPVNLSSNTGKCKV